VQELSPGAAGTPQDDLSSTGFDGGAERYPRSRLLSGCRDVVLGLVLDWWNEAALPPQPTVIELVDVLGDGDL
jgi:hypothetical protein